MFVVFPAVAFDLGSAFDPIGRQRGRRICYGPLATSDAFDLFRWRSMGEEQTRGSRGWLVAGEQSQADVRDEERSERVSSDEPHGQKGRSDTSEMEKWVLG